MQQTDLVELGGRVAPPSTRQKDANTNASIPLLKAPSDQVGIDCHQMHQLHLEVINMLISLIQLMVCILLQTAVGQPLGKGGRLAV